MANTVKTVEELAIANLKKGDEAKGIDRIKREVKNNKRAWSNEIGDQDALVDSCQDAVNALKGDTSVSSEEVCDAKEALKIAQADLSTMKEEFTSRFGTEVAV